MKRLLGVAAVLALCIWACKPSVDFSAGRPYACDYDAGSGCEGGWVCGVLGTCIDPDDAGSNACRTDVDCFHGRRCNVEGICLDPSAELLNATNAAPGPITVLAPLFVPQGVTQGQFAYGVQPRTGDPLLDNVREWTAIASSGGQITLFSSRSSDYPVKAADGGVFANVQSVAANGGLAWVMTDTNLFQIFTGFGSNFGTVTPVHVNGGANLGPGWDLRTSYFTNVDLIALAQDGGSDFHLVRGPNAGVVRSGPFPTRGEILGFDTCLLAINPGTVSVANSVDAGWAQLVLPELMQGTCDDGGVAPLRASAATPNLLAISQECAPPDPTLLDGNYATTSSRVWLYDLSGLLATGDDAGPPPCIPVTSGSGAPHDTRVTQLLIDCNPCQLNNEVLLSFFPLVLDQQYAVESTCVSAAGPRTYQVTQALDGTCTRTRVPDTSPQFETLLSPPFGGTNPFTLARAGTHGQLYTGDNLTTSKPMFLDRAPTAFFLPLSRDGGTIPLHMFEANIQAEVTPFGLETINANKDNPIVSAIGGAAAQVLYSDGALATLKDNVINVFASVAAQDNVFIPPFGARYIARADGRMEHLVRSFDSLYVGHPDPANPSANFTLKLALVPSGGSPLSSFTLLAPDDPDAGLLTGYALTPTGLFKIDESPLEEWSAVPVPIAPGDRVEVFSAEGTKSRLGYDDGVVYSLPSRIPIASPLPGGARVTDYQQACLETWALTNQGLFRLVPDADGTGHWQNEPLDAGDDFSATALVGGRVTVFGGTMYVFNAFGGGLTFVPQGGCLGDAGM